MLRILTKASHFLRISGIEEKLRIRLSSILELLLTDQCKVYYNIKKNCFYQSKFSVSITFITQRYLILRQPDIPFSRHLCYGTILRCEDGNTKLLTSSKSNLDHHLGGWGRLSPNCLFEHESIVLFWLSQPD